MQKVVLGRTGLSVSVACLGAGGHSRLGAGTGKSTGESIAIVKAALDEGVTIFDTAANYGTEAILGEALEGVRDGVVISTKGAIATKGDSPGVERLVPPAVLRASVEKSLSNLRTDYIDVFHLHAVAATQYGYCVDTLVPELQRLRGEGKVRFFGITEKFNSDPTHGLLELALKDDIWDVIMVGYNIFNQTAARNVFPATRRGGVGTLCMFAVRWGLVDVEHAKTLIADLVGRGEIDAGEFDPADPFGFLVEGDRRIPLTEAAYRFCRHSPGVDVVMTGTGSRSHLEENIRTIGMPPLPEAVVDKLRKAFAKVTSATGDTVARLG